MIFCLKRITGYCLENTHLGVKNITIITSLAILPVLLLSSPQASRALRHASCSGPACVFCLLCHENSYAWPESWWPSALLSNVIFSVRLLQNCASPHTTHRSTQSPSLCPLLFPPKHFTANTSCNVLTRFSLSPSLEHKRHDNRGFCTFCLPDTFPTPWTQDTVGA